MSKKTDGVKQNEPEIEKTEPETKDLNERALEKVEEKFAEQNGTEAAEETVIAPPSDDSKDAQSDDTDESSDSSAEVVPSGRLLAAGTKLQIAGETVTLAEDVVVNYLDEANEARFVGMLNHSDNMEANRHNLKFRYDGLGRRLPLEEQVDDTADLPIFIANLTELEADSFGIPKSQWEEYKGE